MESTKPKQLREGFQLISLQSSSEEHPLRICVVVRERPDPVAGSLVPLYQLADANVFLGCVADEGKNIVEWLEIWIQNTARINRSEFDYEGTLSNTVLDKRWKNRATAIQKLEGASYLQTVWQERHPPPLYLDLDTFSPIFLRDSDTGVIWRLCQDDKALEEAGLPIYSESCYRYLYIPSQGTASFFLPLQENAPTSEAVKPLAETLGLSKNLLPFNPEGGLMLLRFFAPLSLGDFIQLLSGKAWRGVGLGKESITLGGVYATLQDVQQIQQGGGHLFLGLQGRKGRLIETFHLKLQLLTDLMQSIYTVVKQQQLPFLNITPESFRVRFGEISSHLPYLWNSKVVLTQTAESLALPIETSDTRYFQPIHSIATSIYRPESISLSGQGTGSVRIREVLEKSDGSISIEGTLVTNERLDSALSDLLYLRLPLGSRKLNVFTRLSSAEGLAQGEARFRSLSQTVTPEMLGALKAAQGVPLSQTYFEMQPVVRTPCDLYSLGVIGLQILLVNEHNTLPVVLDECLSLAHQVAIDYNEEEDLLSRLCKIVQADTRWLNSLGPHRLILEDISAVEAIEIIPLELWWEAISILIKLFPGIGKDSICRDLGDVSPFALETVFEEPLRDLESILTRSRSLILIDWTYNREVADVIRKVGQRFVEV